jgi:hypothetical protein
MDPLHALFADAQRTAASHARAASAAAKLIAKAKGASTSSSSSSALSSLSASLHDCVDRALVVGKADAAVDRVLAFACKVATAEECALLHPLMEVSRRRGRKCLQHEPFAFFFLRLGPNGSSFLFALPLRRCAPTVPPAAHVFA